MRAQGLEMIRIKNGTLSVARKYFLAIKRDKCHVELHFVDSRQLRNLFGDLALRQKGLRLLGYAGK